MFVPSTKGYVVYCVPNANEVESRSNRCQVFNDRFAVGDVLEFVEVCLSICRLPQRHKMMIILISVNMK